MTTYGSWYLTTLGSVIPVVADTPEEMIWLGGTTSGPLSGVTNPSNARFAVTSTGVYLYEFTVSFSWQFNLANVLKVSYAVDSVIDSSWDQARRTQLNTDIGNMAGYAVLSLTAGETVSLWVECDNNGQLTFAHAAGTIRRIDT